MKVRVSGDYTSAHTRNVCTPLTDWPDDKYPPLCTRCLVCIVPGMRYVIVDSIYVFCTACDPGA